MGRRLLVRLDTVLFNHRLPTELVKLPRPSNPPDFEIAKSTRDCKRRSVLQHWLHSWHQVQPWHGKRLRGSIVIAVCGVSCLQVQGLDYLLDQRPWGRVEGLGSHGIINCHQHPLKIYKHLTSTYTLDVHILDWTPFQKLPGMNDLETGVPGIEVATETLNPNT